MDGAQCEVLPQPRSQPNDRGNRLFGDTPWKKGGRERSLENGSDALSIYIFVFLFFYYGNVSRNTGNKCAVSKEARPAPQAHYLEVRGTARGRRNERLLGQFFPTLLVRFCPPVNRAQARSSTLPEEGPDSFWVASTRHSLPSQHVARRVGRIFAAEEKVQRFGNGRRFLPTSVPPRFVFEGRPRFIKPELGSE